MRRTEAGQTLPLVALMIVVAGGAMLLLGSLGGAAVSRAQAQTAADAAALAGVLDGPAEASSVAAANGGRLVQFEERGGQAFVRVEVGRATATARARRGSAGSGRSGVRAGRTAPTPGGLAPALQLALAQAARLLGRGVPITSGYRSPAEQARLWAARSANPYPVARPGTSAHERGMAVDVPRRFVADLLRVAARVGLCQPYPSADPVHFELCRLPSP